MTTRTTRWLGLAAALAVATAGCSTGDDTAASTTTTSAAVATTAPATSGTSATGPTITTPPASNPLLDTMAPLKLPGGHTWNKYQLEIFESYVRAEQAALKAHLEAPAGNSTLNEHFISPRLETMEQSVMETRSTGFATTSPSVFEIRPYRFDAASEDRVIFFACYTSNEATYEVSTRRVASDEIVSELKEVGMRRVDGRWRVAVRSTKPEWEGKSCDDAYSSL